jgi:hypothetical protein
VFGSAGPIHSGRDWEVQNRGVHSGLDGHDFPTPQRDTSMIRDLEMSQRSRAVRAIPLCDIFGNSAIKAPKHFSVLR